MPDLGRPTTPIPPPGRRGFVSEAPAGLGEPFTVTVPDFDAYHVFEIRRWMPRGETLPKAGDEVLVVLDETGEPWVPAWWPAGGP